MKLRPQSIALRFLATFVLVLPDRLGESAVDIRDLQFGEAIAMLRQRGANADGALTCGLHRLGLISGCARTVWHGDPCTDRGDRDFAQGLYFPNANSRVHIDGCVVSSAPISTPATYCPRCREAEADWEAYTSRHAQQYPAYLEWWSLADAESAERALPNNALQRTRFARR